MRCYNASSHLYSRLHTVAGLLEAMTRVVVRGIDIDAMSQLLQAECRVHHESLRATCGLEPGEHSVTYSLNQAHLFPSQDE